ncbi:MAG: LuxR C-terminal-related transcriptional regulator, partial [Coriobacteriales bacterium]|nr:LuxR C-terminal-related transcriptional regulator [Coriobacteriales bacterium]
HKGLKVSGSAVRRFETRLPIYEVIGFSFYLGWILLLYFGTPLAPPEYYRDDDAHLMRIVMTATVAASYLLAGVFAKPLASRAGNRFLIVCVVLFSPLVGLVLFSPIASFSFLLTAWGFVGVGHAMILILWSKHLVLFNRKQLILITSLSFICAGALYVIISYLQQSPATVATLTLPLISLAFFVFGNRNAEAKIEALRKETLPDQSIRTHDRRTLLQLYIYAVSYCIALGFMGACVSLSVFQNDSVPFIGLANVLAGLGMVLMLVYFKRDVARIIAASSLPCMALGVFLFAFSGDIGHWAQLSCLALLFFLFACYDVVNITTVSKSSGLFGIDYIRTFGFGRFPNGLGVCLGWICGYLVFFTYGGSALAIIFISFLIVVLFVFANALVFVRPARAFVSDEGPAFAPQGAKSALNRARKPGKQAALPTTQRTVDGVETLVVDRASVSVHLLVDEYSLSNRQAEVLAYLARGRNAEYIQEKLVVSNHTAKSHIYTIYRKLGVHSQQELIDMIESFYED